MKLIQKRPLFILLAVFIVLALIYTWATPLFEASDELWHFGMVQYIAETGRLPVQVIDVETTYEQEGSQPPLYYLIAAALVKPIDRTDFDVLRQPNPHAVAGVPGNVGNKNLVLHSSPHPSLERTALAVYILRLFSIFFGCVTVFAVYKTASLFNDLWPGVAVLAAGLTAFDPMFLFITGSVNNDNLVTALNSLVIWQLIVLLDRGFSTRRSLIIAVLIALASLSKLSGLVLVPVVALAGLWIASRPLFATPRGRFEWRGLFTLGLSMLAAWLLLAGWWYFRNLTLYGELFGTHTMALVAGAREGGFTLQTLLSEFQGFRFGYWGVFGAFNIMTFRWFYDVMDILTIFTFVGFGLLIIRTWNQYRRRLLQYRVFTFQLIALISIVIIGLISVISWTSQTYASQGRLLFPFVAAISSLFALGLVALFSFLTSFVAFPISLIAHYVSLIIHRFLVVTFGFFAFIVPIVSIAPQYTPPPLLTALPASAQQVYARFGDVALIGYETSDRRYLPGDYVPITLYWQTLQSTSTNLSLYLHATLDDGSVIGKVDSYPGGGTLQTSMWQQGAIYTDTYAIPLDSAADTISKLRVQVGWWDYPTGAGINAVDGNDQALPSVMLDVGGFAPHTTQLLAPGFTPVSDVDFSGIRLLGYTLEGDNLTLLWESPGALSANNTVFVQILDAENTIVGQGDAPPLLPTRFWLPGEHFVTSHTITYTTPPSSGDYRVVIGWYNPVDFTRLDTASPDDAYPLTIISIP